MTDCLCVKGFNEITYDELMDVVGGGFSASVSYENNTFTASITIGSFSAGCSISSGSITGYVSWGNSSGGSH